MIKLKTTVVVTNQLPTIPTLPAGEGRSENSPKISRIGPLNRHDHSSQQTIGQPFSLSQRERAGVRENRSNEYTVHGEGESFEGRCHLICGEGKLLAGQASLAYLLILCLVLVGISTATAEIPGEFRPQPVPHPTEKCGATGDVVEPPDELPVSRAPLVNTAHRKPKLTNPGQPALRGNDLVFDAGWEMIDAPKLHVDGAALSQPGVDTADWYDATVPGTVLTTLVNEGVYPDPYFGLNNRLTPESLNKQDYWYRTEFTLPENFSGRRLTLQFNGINYYAEVWFNGQYLGHITGAFIRGTFDVTGLAHADGKNVLAVMIAPPPDPGLLSEESVKFGPRLNGGKLCLDGPSFQCSEGWDWIPPIRDRDSGIWQDVTLRATGPVTIEDPQVITRLPLPDTSRADVTVQTDLRNLSDAIQHGTLEGSFEGVQFEQPVTLQPGETTNICFDPKDFSQLTVQNPRLWWPNGYGNPELYHLALKFLSDNGDQSDHTALRFGIREMSYEFEVKKPDGSHERVEYTPLLLPRSDKPVIDNRRYTMVYGPENTARRNAAIVAAGGKIPKTPFHWGQGQQTTPGLWPGMEDSPALQPATDTNMGMYLVIKVNGRRIECIGGDWGMDDAMKQVSREH
ncbi:MAG TPA: beta galactosidase jelly roll domain-containing protein, partial [Verrucomicrobiae bacterium]